MAYHMHLVTVVLRGGVRSLANCRKFVTRVICSDRMEMTVTPLDGHHWPVMESRSSPIPSGDPSAQLSANATF
jgi:hypothetical protein